MGAPGPISGSPRGGSDPIIDPVPSIAANSAPVAIPGGDRVETDAMEGVYSGDLNHKVSNSMSSRKPRRGAKDQNRM